MLIAYVVSAFLVPLFIMLAGTKYVDGNTKCVVLGGFLLTSFFTGVVAISSYSMQILFLDVLNKSIIANTIFSATCILLPNLLLSLYFFIRAHNQSIRINKKQVLFSQATAVKNKYFNSNVFFIIMMVFFLMWVFLTDFKALTAPRVAYQSYREGIGFVWALMITFMVLWYSNSLIENQKVNLLNVIILCLIAYCTGSKQVMLGIILLMPFQPFISWRARKVLMLIALFAAPVMFLFLFGQLTAEKSLLFRMAAYFKTSQLGAIIFDSYYDGTLEYYYGEIYLTGFWGYIPRAIYPDKPFAYGSTFLLGVYFPGMAETGATPSFGFSRYFADFGWYGALLSLLQLRVFIQFYAIKIVTSQRTSALKPIAFGILFFPFYSFHAPIQLTLAVHYIVNKLKLRRFKWG